MTTATDEVLGFVKESGVLYFTTRREGGVEPGRIEKDLKGKESLSVRDCTERSTQSEVCSERHGDIRVVRPGVRDEDDGGVSVLGRVEWNWENQVIEKTDGVGVLL